MTDADVGIRVSIRGMDEAKRSFKDLVGDVKRNERALERMNASPRGNRGGSGGESTRPPGRSGPGVSSVAAGNLIAGMINAGFSALTRSIQAAFDPTAMRQERQAAAATGVLSMVPGVGPALSGVVNQLLQEQIAPARNTAARIHQMLDPAIRASGLTNPEDIRKRFGEDIRHLRDYFLPQEEASRAGMKAISSEIGDDIDPGAVRDEAVRTVKEMMEAMGIKAEDLLGILTKIYELIHNAVENHGIAAVPNLAVESGREIARAIRR